MLKLEAVDKALLGGEFGPAAARAMEILIAYAEAVGADRFVSIASAHIDGCLYHGPSSTDFVRLFVGLGGRVRTLTTLNVAAVDTVHPQWHRGRPELLAAQRELNALYIELGCVPALTCAPYQRIVRPKAGEHIAWAESNAIVFANSVLGARTDRYGDFTDVTAALTGRAPYAGLHRDENRHATLFVDVVELASSGLARDLYASAVGYALGRVVDGRVPLMCGLHQDITEDELKALGAASASSGALALFHALGITPEAGTIEAAMGGRPVEARTTIGPAELAMAVQTLNPLRAGEPIAAMCLGTPHYSRTQFARLAELMSGRRAAIGVEVYVSTSREIAAEVEASSDHAALEQFGVRMVVDTCTYLAPVVAGAGAIVTDSAKYAHYGPGNLTRRVGLMAVDRCVASAEQGSVVAR